MFGKNVIYLGVTSLLFNISKFYYYFTVLYFTNILKMSIFYELFFFDSTYFKTTQSFHIFAYVEVSVIK